MTLCKKSGDKSEENMSPDKRITYTLVFPLICAILQSCIGEESPLYKFVLKDISGKDINLGQYREKVNFN